jgi:hypothetical protein
MIKGHCQDKRALSYELNQTREPAKALVEKHVIAHVAKWADRRQKTRGVYAENTLRRASGGSGRCSERAFVRKIAAR